MKKYLLLAVLALAAFGMVFTGCDNSSSWEPSDDYGKAITITFKANGHGTAPDPIRTRAGQEIQLPQMAAADGFVNTAWYLDSAYQSGSIAVGTWQKFTENTTLYGYWTNQKFNIIWNVNDPAVRHIANTQQYDRSAVVFPAEDPVHPDEYPFMGWFTGADGKEKVAAGYEITKDEEFFAQWGRPIEVTWSVDGNTSYYTPAQLPDQLSFGAVQFPADPVNADGKPFGGWYDADGNAVTAETIVHGGEIFHAKWGYVITLDKTGGTENGKAGAVAGKTQLSGITDPVKAGYAVMSYFTDSTCAPETRIAGADGKFVPGVDGLTDADGKWIATEGKTFYVKWGKKLGGLVYYAEKTGAAAECYKFYDEAGKELTVEEPEYGVSFYTDDTKTVKATAVYYDDIGKSAEDKDRYYVVNNKLNMSNTYTWTYKKSDGSIAKENLCNGLVLIGKGRENTKTIMEKDGGAYVTKDNGLTTIWYNLNRLNNGLWSDNGGCSDWFVPSLNELLEVVKLINTKAWQAADNEGSAPYVSKTDYPEWAVLVNDINTSYTWSSSGANDANAQMWNSNTGISMAYSKGNVCHLVAVRAF